MENPKATSNDFPASIIQGDISFQGFSIFLNNEEHSKDQMATLNQEMKNLQSELPEHRVNAVEGNPRTADTSQKGKQMQPDFAIIAAQTDMPQVGAARSSEMKN